MGFEFQCHANLKQFCYGVEIFFFCLVMAIRLNHTVIPVCVKLGAPARVSARSSLPFSIGDWRGVSTFSGARSLVFAKVKHREESTEEDQVPIEDSIHDDDSTDQLVSAFIESSSSLNRRLVCNQNHLKFLMDYSSFVRLMKNLCILKSVIFPAQRVFQYMLCYQ